MNKPVPVAKTINEFYHSISYLLAHCFGSSHDNNITVAQSSPYDADISTLVQNGLVDLYKSNNETALILPGNQQDGIECWNNLAGLECSNSIISFNMERFWHSENFGNDLIKPIKLRKD